MPSRNTRNTGKSGRGKPRTWKAWALVQANGNLVTRDYRLPLTWYRRHAKEDAADYGGRIIRVTITETPKDRK